MFLCHIAVVLLALIPSCLSLTESSWRRLPHLPHSLTDRRDVLTTGTASMISILGGSEPAFAAEAPQSSVGSSIQIQSNLAIPLWPSWGGGRVVPVSLGGPLQDPFLLLAHHKHWFDPRDFLREPFKQAGKALGLPYVDVEGFSMHPHRGFDILTYVLDGSDGFKHRDSLGGSRIYRGGTAQWMRTGAGVLHEEFWETRPDQRTNIELFQLWINLPAAQKFDAPMVQYLGDDTNYPWDQHESDGVTVRNIGDTLDASLDPERDVNVNRRPPVSMWHVILRPGTQWRAPIPTDHSALMYVREGTAALASGQSVSALQSATFDSKGESILIGNDADNNLDLLFLSGQKLKEPVALGGPIVMNTEQELNDAYRQLSDGTFLKRDIALRQQARTQERMSRFKL